jgi:predicted Zn-dependent protease
MPVPVHLILRVAACLSAISMASACGSSDRRAQAALSAYQTAAAANDVVAARRALLQLVGAKDDVPDYWVELGKLQASTGSYGDAYYAFTRAYELDRGNPDLLRAVTELALRSGDLALAQSHARELEVVAPGDPWVKLTQAWAAFAESRFDDAIAASDSLLASSPFEPNATILKARALLGLHRVPEAEAVLTKQVQVQPSDAGSLDLLAKIYLRQNDWAKVAEMAGRLNALSSADRRSALLLIEAAFRAGNTAKAHQASLNLLRPNSERTLVQSVLDLWTNYLPLPQRLADARRLAAAASGLDQKLTYAEFLSRWGSPADAVRVSSSAATLPVNAKNSEANAVLADAWFRSGNFAAAKSRFDAVIAFDPGNSTALRGRSELELKSGNAAAAIIDAQKLVTVLPQSSEDRLLLARSYSAAGKDRWADRTLWDAFQAIPADGKVFAALAARKRGDADGLRDLREEFDRQLDAKLNRGLL